MGGWLVHAALAGLLAGSLGGGGQSATRPARAALAPVLGAPLASFAAAATPPRPPATVNAPQDLQRLIESSSALRLSTAIVSAHSRASFSGHALPGSTSSLHLDFAHHSELVVTTTGGVRMTLRVFGREVYTEIESRRHRRRRWVMIRVPRSVPAPSIDASSLTAGGVVAALQRQATPGSVIGVTEGASAAIGGRPVQEFTFTFGIDGPRLRGSVVQRISASVSAYFAANGLLMREIATVDLLGIENVEQDDLVAVNAPMRIRRPARRDTTVVSSLPGLLKAFS